MAPPVRRVYVTGSVKSRRHSALGITEGKQVGWLVGDVMKTHKGQVEAADVKRIAEELLAAR
ncbi:MAG: hypothetical protein DMD83_10310 [Candidatus Rokuibacteriota bacterium]|nr:MAG: hypothetical protein DMD83_10310 [Candidatus Rokubacteria bacterium]